MIKLNHDHPIILYDTKKFRITLKNQVIQKSSRKIKNKHHLFIILNKHIF